LLLLLLMPLLLAGVMVSIIQIVCNGRLSCIML
jgi:hypothetical protein